MVKVVRGHEKSTADVVRVNLRKINRENTGTMAAIKRNNQKQKIYG